MTAQTIHVPGSLIGNSSNGNVGIGTTTPAQKLTVQAGHGDTQLRLFSDAYGQGTDGANTALLSFWASEPGWSWTGAGIGNNVTMPNGIARITNTRGGSYLRLLDNVIVFSTVDSQGTDRPAIYIVNGKVGIGNGDPGFRLDVTDRIRTRASGSGSAGIWLHNGVTDVGFIGDANSDRMGFWGNTGAGWGFVMNTTNGNVGIGTLTPTHKLAVSGTIRAKEVIVDTGWSDYVFADDYRLTPLTEVETHIREKKHLPGIPTAAEVAEGGVSLGDMQARLLAKVEELTLHLIEQEKEMRSLRTRNSALESRLELLEERSQR